MSHLEEHNVITDKQHAFRKHHSCETQLCSVIHDWARNIDNNEQTDIFILDFEKAFDTDTVPHEQLKAKLYRYGITGKTLMWIDSFLCYRKQGAVANGTKYYWSVVQSGVPQGTVSVLFSLHINDTLDNISSDKRLFADDWVCCRVIDSTEDCKILQNDIDELGSWARK
jgi:hypothetical protein